MLLPHPHEVTIEIKDVRDIKACEYAIDRLYSLIEEEHGLVTVQRLFAKKVLKKRQFHAFENARLMILYTVLNSKRVNERKRGKLAI
jgi:hypothetical protein